MSHKGFEIPIRASLTHGIFFKKLSSDSRRLNLLHEQCILALCCAKFLSGPWSERSCGSRGQWGTLSFCWLSVWPETRAAPDKELRPLLGVTGLLHKEQSPLPGQLFSSRVTPETPEWWKKITPWGQKIPCTSKECLVPLNRLLS